MAVEDRLRRPEPRCSPGAGQGKAGSRPELRGGYHISRLRGKSSRKDFPFRPFGARILLVRRTWSVYEEVSMFESLSDRIKADDREEVNSTERIIRWVLMLVLSVVLFGGLYMGVRLLE